MSKDWLVKYLLSRMCLAGYLIEVGKDGLSKDGVGKEMLDEAYGRLVEIEAIANACLAGAYLEKVSQRLGELIEATKYEDEEEK